MLQNFNELVDHNHPGCLVCGVNPTVLSRADCESCRVKCFSGMWYWYASKSVTAGSVLGSMVQLEYLWDVYVGGEVAQELPYVVPAKCDLSDALRLINYGEKRSNVFTVGDGEGEMNGVELYRWYMEELMARYLQVNTADIVRDYTGDVVTESLVRHGSLIFPDSLPDMTSVLMTMNRRNIPVVMGELPYEDGVSDMYKVIKLNGTILVMDYRGRKVLNEYDLCTVDEYTRDMDYEIDGVCFRLKVIKTEGTSFRFFIIRCAAGLKPVEIDNRSEVLVVESGMHENLCEKFIGFVDIDGMVLARGDEFRAIESLAKFSVTATHSWWKDNVFGKVSSGCVMSRQLYDKYQLDAIETVRWNVVEVALDLNSLVDTLHQLNVEIRKVPDVCPQSETVKHAIFVMPDVFKCDSRVKFISPNLVDSLEVSSVIVLPSLVGLSADYLDQVVASLCLRKKPHGFGLVNKPLIEFKNYKRMEQYLLSQMDRSIKTVCVSVCGTLSTTVNLGYVEKLVSFSSKREAMDYAIAQGFCGTDMLPEAYCALYLFEYGSWKDVYRLLECGVLNSRVAKLLLARGYPMTDNVLLFQTAVLNRYHIADELNRLCDGTLINSKELLTWVSMSGFRLDNLTLAGTAGTSSLDVYRAYVRMMIARTVETEIYSSESALNGLASMAGVSSIVDNPFPFGYGYLLMFKSSVWSKVLGLSCWLPTLDRSGFIMLMDHMSMRDQSHKVFIGVVNGEIQYYPNSNAGVLCIGRGQYRERVLALYSAIAFGGSNICWDSVDSRFLGSREKVCNCSGGCRDCGILNLNPYNRIDSRRPVRDERKLLNFKGFSAILGNLYDDESSFARLVDMMMHLEPIAHEFAHYQMSSSIERAVYALDVLLIDSKPMYETLSRDNAVATLQKNVVSVLNNIRSHKSMLETVKSCILCLKSL